MTQEHMDQADTAGWDLERTKIHRRSFVSVAFGAGLAGSTFPTILLGGCSSPASKKTELQWVSSGTTNKSFDFLVKLFNETNQDNISVKLISADPYSSKFIGQNIQQYEYYTRLLGERKPQPDILSLDIVWMKEFATRDWIYPLDQYWRDTLRTDSYFQQLRHIYLQKPLDTVHFKIAEDQPKRMWGAPHYTDVGILYYRTDMPDIISPDPEQAKQWTWDDIKGMCKKANAHGLPAWRFAWQGKLYEGLVCNFLEVLSNYKGQIFDDPVEPKTVFINSPEAIEALQQMVDWTSADGISSKSILTDDEDTSKNLWIQGNAAFMRNWPGPITASSDANSPLVAEKFQVVTLPSHSQSCLGGWELTINKFSPHKDEAWKFIHWLLQENAQQYLALKEAFPVTLQSVYDNSYVQEQMPFYSSLKDIIEGAQFRPMSPHYQSCVSAAIQQCVHNALANPSCYTPQMALTDLERELRKILQLNPSASCTSPANIISGCH